MAENNKDKFAPHVHSVEDVLNEFDSKKEGLTEKQASEKLDQFGKNIIEGKKQKSLFQLALDQINNPVIYLLMGAAVVSFIFGDIPEAIAIIVVIILNTAIGFWMEYQARTSVKALKKLNRLQVRVVRDGETKKTDAANVVPGDIIDLAAGDLVPADARVISYTELKVDESPLTGESLPVEKNTEKLDEETQLADRANMLYKGTALTNGKARAVVTSTGQQTEIGKISEMAEEEDKDKIPLNRKLHKLSHRLIWVTVGLAALFFIIGWIAGEEVYLMLQTAIAWTVAAIPEGLPIVASIALARGMLRLSKRNVIVKKLAAVETLGETTVIFTDKTGTLTENKLSVDSIHYPENDIEAGSLIGENDKPGKNPESENFSHIFKVSVFANDAKEKENNGKKQLIGDPLDVSVLEFFKKYDAETTQKLKENEQINEDPFDSEDKFMGAVHRLEDKLYISAKGAADPIFSKSKSYLDNGEEKDISEDFRKEWMKKYEELSGKGLKVIAYAYRTEDKSQDESLKGKEEFVKDMIFLGFVSFIDPAKEDVKPSIKKCQTAGIKIIMVTGDHPGTAENVARKVGLSADEKYHVMKGSDIENNKEEVIKSNIFARVDPKQKYNIVEDFKDKGEITAMTGDGVNDAPALKKADIGIAMGERGTQIAQDVADMILKDDSFPSIVDAIEEGRIIFENIRKFIVYQLSYHLAEIIIIAGISFSLFYLPLLPLQLLFLNLLSDVFPALALGLGKGDETIMQQKPKDPEEPIINKHNWTAMAIYAIVMAAIITGVYLLTYYQFEESKELANTVTFFSLALSQLLHVFNMREPEENIFVNQVVKNKYIWMALGICIAALVAAYLIPLFHDVLSFETLSGIHWLLVGGASVATLIVIQIIKQIFKF
ncbi:MAG: cation-translocating P-type ATPase [Tangfeifania sp.]